MEAVSYFSTFIILVLSLVVLFYFVIMGIKGQNPNTNITIGNV